MEDLEGRLVALEARLRRYHRLTLGLLAIVLLLIAVAGIRIWNSIPRSIEDLVKGDVLGRSLQVWDPDPRLKITATETGWTLQMPIVGERFAKPGAAALTYSLSESRPSLVMTDGDGKEVWRAP